MAAMGCSRDCGCDVAHGSVVPAGLPSVGGGHAGEQGIAFQAVSWCQSVKLDFVVPFILGLWNQTSCHQKWQLAVRRHGRLLRESGRTVRRWIFFAHLDAEGRVPPGAIFRDRKSRTRRDRMSLRAGPDQAGS
jgi:hypothetical protein